MSGLFAKKVALVTGAGSGIGEACAKTLAARGAQVVVADIDVGRAERVVREIKAAGGTAAAIAADVADPASRRSAVRGSGVRSGRVR